MRYSDMVMQMLGGQNDVGPNAPPPTPTPRPNGWPAPGTYANSGATRPSEADLQYWHDLARQTASNHGIDPELFVRQIWRESMFDNAWPKGDSGELGLMQMTPSYLGNSGIDPRNPEQAMDFAAKNLKQSVDSYGGDYRKAFAAYNAGPRAVAQYGGVPPFALTQSYVKDIMGDAGNRFGFPVIPPYNGEANINERAQQDFQPIQQTRQPVQPTFQQSDLRYDSTDGHEAGLLGLMGLIKQDIGQNWGGHDEQWRANKLAEMRWAEMLLHQIQMAPQVGQGE